MNDMFKNLLAGSSHSIMWVVAFIGVCVLVGLGKLDPKVIEFLVMSLGGAVAASNSQVGMLASRPTTITGSLPSAPNRPAMGFQQSGQDNGASPPQ